jgi:hypothetical protein
VALRQDVGSPLAILKPAGDRLVLMTVLPADADLGCTPVLFWCGDRAQRVAGVTRARWREMQHIANWRAHDDAAGKALRDKMLEDLWED